MSTARRAALLALLVVSACAKHPAAAPPEVIVTGSAGGRVALDPGVLRGAFAKLLDQAGLPAPGPVMAVVIPHAGLHFSGAAAASALAAVRDRKIARVVLLAPGHPALKPGEVDVPAAQTFRTPLGDVPVDATAVAYLARQGGVRRSDAPFAHEHSVGAVLPLLQIALGSTPLVPVAVGAIDAAGARALAAALRPLVDSSTLVVVSTNLTHAGPRFHNGMFGDAQGAALAARIRQADEILLQPALRDELPAFDALARSTHTTLCGQDAVRVLLALLPPGSKGVVRAYDNSFNHDAAEGKDEVSYAGIAFAGRWPDLPPLPEADRSALLGAARAALAAALAPGPPPAPPLDSPALVAKRGVFVTLFEHGAVRASVGQVSSDAALGRTLVDVATAAVGGDPRFPPLARGDLGSLGVEVAVLGPLHALGVDEPFDPAHDGLYLSAPGHTAVLLPDPLAPAPTLAVARAALAKKADLAEASWPKGALSRFEVQTLSDLAGPPAKTRDAGR